MHNLFRFQLNIFNFFYQQQTSKK